MALEPVQVEVQVNVKDPNLKTSLQVDIAKAQVNLAQLKKELKQATDTPTKIQVQADINQAQKSLKTLQTEMKQSSQGWLKNNLWWLGTSLLSTAWIWLWISGAVSMLSWFFKSAYEWATQEETAMAQLNNTLNITWKSAQVTAEQLKELAKQQAVWTGIDDDVIISLDEIVLRYHNLNANILPKFQKMILDVATAENNGIIPSTEQVLDATGRFAKILNDPVNMLWKLKKAGVEFTATEVEQIKAFQKHWDVMSADEIVMDRISSLMWWKFATAMNTTSGKVAEAKRERWEFTKLFWENILFPIVDELSRAFINMWNTIWWVFNYVSSKYAQFSNFMKSVPIIWWFLTSKSAPTWPTKAQTPWQVASLFWVGPDLTTLFSDDTESYTGKWWWGWTSKAQTELKDIQSQMDSNIKTANDYWKKIDDLQKKFDDLRDKAISDLSEVNNQIADVTKTQWEDLAKRYVEINNSIAKWWLDATEYNALLKEKAYIEWKDTQAVLDQATAYDKLSESEKMVADNAKTIATLQEKASIDKAFTSGKLTASMDKNWVLTASVTDDKGKATAITDFKNQQYALDLVNQNNALKVEQQQLVDSATFEVNTTQQTAAKKLDINKKYHDQVMKLIEEEHNALTAMITLTNSTWITTSPSSITNNNNNTTVNATVTNTSTADYLVHKLTK